MGQEKLAEYSESAPDRHVSDLVACHWQFRSLAPQPTLNLIPPDGSVSIAFVPNPQQPRLVFVGAHLEPIEALNQPNETMYGVRLWPGASRAVLGVPGDVLARKKGLLLDVAPQFAATAMPRLSAVAQPGQYQHAFETLVPPGHLDLTLAKALAETLKHRGSIAVPALAEAAMCSRRRLERLFATEVGLSPAEFARIVRLRWAVRWSMESGGAHLGEIAAEAGYSDHAHMCREFQLILGYTPTGFVEDYAGGVDHGILVWP